MKNKKNNQKSTTFKGSPYFTQFATHISKDTIITKNTHILQTIRIQNFYCDSEVEKNSNDYLKDLIRIAIQKNIHSTEFSFWLHTVRRRVDLNKFYNSKEFYSNGAFESWSNRHKLNEQFVNEVYLTVIYKGVTIKNQDITKKSFSHEKIKDYFFNDIEEKERQLSETVNNILLDLKKYKPEKLSIIEEEGIMYSQNIEFFHKIVNLVDLKVEVQEADISNILNISTYTLNQNTLTVSNEFGSKTIASLTLKQYHDASIFNINQIFSLPCEFIIYQTFNFSNANSILSKSYLQYKILKVSKDERMMKNLNLTDAEFKSAETNKDKITTLYGDSQVGIIVIGADEEDLQKNLKIINSATKQTGFVFAREDVDIEQSFYASIPANFYFLKRLQPLLTSKIGGFTSIDCYPFGKPNFNKWGESIAIFQTPNKTPYFFNLHHQDKPEAHTILFGTENNIYQYSILHFIILNTFKFNTRVLILDTNQNAKLFTSFVGGEYKHLSLDEKDLINNKQRHYCTNPSLLLTNKMSLYKIAKESLKTNKAFSKKNITYLKEVIIPLVLNNKKSINNLEDFIKVINNPEIINTFFKPFAKKDTKHIFNSKNQDVVGSLKNGELLSIDISELLSEGKENEKRFILKYILEQILLMTKDKLKTIIKIDYFFWFVLDGHFTQNEICNFLKTLSENNAILITVEDYKMFSTYTKQEKDDEIFDYFQNQIFIPPFTETETETSRPSNQYLKHLSKIIKLNDKSLQTIKQHSHNEEIFTFKYGADIVPLYFNEEFSDLYFFFLSNSKIKNYFTETLNKCKTEEQRLEEAKSIYKILFS